MSKEEIENQKKAIQVWAWWIFNSFSLRYHSSCIHPVIFQLFTCCLGILLLCFLLLSSPGIHLGDKPGYRFMLCHRLGNLFISE